MLIVFYTLSLIALLTGTAAIYLALIERFPISWLYYHYFVRKPLNWSILSFQMSWTFVFYLQTGSIPLWTIAPVLIVAFSLVLTYRMHQETAFKAVDYPAMTTDWRRLPLEKSMEIAIITYDGVTKCYPLDYVIHHHIINDRFNTKTVSLTYCAMCRTIIPFDVTDIGPLFVASFKNANMIVADRKTKTFFQQATFQSIIGPLHPRELTMIPFQILKFGDVVDTIENPNIAVISRSDLREFRLPVPGIWKKIIASESTPGLSSKNRDVTFPARTRVIGILDRSFGTPVCYLKDEVSQHGVVHNADAGLFLVSLNDTVNGFRDRAGGEVLDIRSDPSGLIDNNSGTRWDVRGVYRSGRLKEDLKPVAISDEYWFSWKRFHKNSKLIRQTDFVKG